MKKFWDEVVGGNDKNLEIIIFHEWYLNNDQYIDLEVTEVENLKSEMKI